MINNHLPYNSQQELDKAFLPDFHREGYTPMIQSLIDNWDIREENSRKIQDYPTGNNDRKIKDEKNEGEKTDKTIEEIIEDEIVKMIEEISEI